MKSFFALASATLLLAACQTVSDTASEGYHGARETAVSVKQGFGEAADHIVNLADAAKEGTYSLTDHVADWMRPTPKLKPKPVAAAYCYSAFQDILCYRQPMPGWEHRLVAYQPGTASPPLPAMIEQLPVHAVDPALLPASRTASAAPVFPTPPAAETAAAEKVAGAQAGAPLAVDATHEQLPDPAMAPQL